MPATTAVTASTRTPVAVWAAAVVLTVLPLVSSGGAVYFTFFYEGGVSLAAGLPFVAVFFAISATGLAAGVGVVRGFEAAWRAALGYCAAMVVWTVAKLVFWHETEAVVFGLAAVAVALLLVTPAARRYVAEEALP